MSAADEGCASLPFYLLFVVFVVQARADLLLLLALLYYSYQIPNSLLKRCNKSCMHE